VIIYTVYSNAFYFNSYNMMADFKILIYYMHKIDSLLPMIIIITSRILYKNYVNYDDVALLLY